eukprot:6575107-Pyramimonas_sp.AAC.1
MVAHPMAHKVVNYRTKASTSKDTVTSVPRNMHACTRGPASAHALGVRPPPRKPDLLKTFTHKSPSRIKNWWT